MASVLSLEQFWQSLARQLLAYPGGDVETLTHRWVELQALDIGAVYDYGPETLAGLKMIGLGYCGVVLRVRHGGNDRVLKIRREPAPQSSLHREANMLMRANEVSVGPQYVAHSDNFLLMDYVQGPTLVDWLQQSHATEDVHRVVTQLIHQAYRLDQAGLDHGDLRCITAHALVQADAPVLIDFSSSSLDRRPANVTTLVQGLFIGTKLAQPLRSWFPQLNKAELVKYLRKYKQQPAPATIALLLSY
ncbi:MAG: RIO1 family regulatory kinase/ATPase, partial [Cyanobacteria bacterium P01_H01_bin.105]